MSGASAARPSEDVLASHLPGETILLHLGTKRYYRLNASASEIWKGVEDESDPGEIVDRLVDAFEVERPEARRAVESQMERLEAEELVVREAATGTEEDGPGEGP